MTDAEDDVFHDGPYSELHEREQAQQLADKQLRKLLLEQQLARHQSQQLVREQLIGPLRVMALLVPKRLWDEEIGDAFEVLERLERAGAPRWQMRLKIWSAVFWVLVNSGRDLVSAALGKSKSGSS
jgi:hypothetical protein